MYFCLYITIGRTSGFPTRFATGLDSTAHIARFASTHDERRHGNVRVPSGDQSTVIVDHQRASRTRLDAAGWSSIVHRSGGVFRAFFQSKKVDATRD